MLEGIEDCGRASINCRPISLQLCGTIYSTSMYNAMPSDKTGRDAANPHSDAGIVDHRNLKHEIFQVVIQIK